MARGRIVKRASENGARGKLVEGDAPSEAWLFAQELLGNPVSDPFAEAAAAAEQELLEWLDDVTYDESGRRGGVDYELLEWLAAVTTIFEGPWDPSKHPRGGYAQNRGWWSPAGGPGGGTSDSLGAKNDRGKHPSIGNRGTGHFQAIGDKAPKQSSNQRAAGESTAKGYTEHRWFERASGVDAGVGGSVKLQDGSTVQVHIYGDVAIKARLNGQWQTEPNGNLKTYPEHVQFEVTGPNCDELHWIHFHRENVLRSDGKPVPGGAKVEGKWAYFGRWYLDAPTPPQGAAPGPNAIYYDNPEADNVYARNKTSLSIFDKGNGSDLGFYNAAKGIVNYKTYLCEKGKVL